MNRRRLRAAAAVLVVAWLAAGTGTAAAGSGPAAGSGRVHDPVRAWVDFARTLQPVDGFGFAQPFQRATIMRGDRGLSAQSRQQVLDLLLDRETGAGLSILRLGIGSSPEAPYDLMKSIQPTDPGGPDATPRYTFDGDDGGQVWLARQAQRYGVTRFYADAWSAPGYMKTNGDDRNGGTLCGLPGATCASGDWRQAYANYLVQYTRFYRSEGVRITDLGFTNEPDLATSYASMQLTPEQAVDMIKVLGRTVRRSGLRMNLLCCDVAGWREQIPYSAAIEADPRADRFTAVHSAHDYRSHTDTPLPTDARTWMSEWSPNGGTWNESWDDGSGWAGISVAESVHEAFATAHATGYVYWFGASVGATRGLIQLATQGDGYRVSKRLWALAAYSRFIRPGASRVAAQAGDPALKLTAFRNADGSRVLEVLNTGTAAVSTSVAVDTRGGLGAAYLTDETHAVQRTGAVRVHGHRLALDLPARSLTTVVLDPPNGARPR